LLNNRLKRVTALVVGLAVFATACGDDGESGGSAATTGGGGATTAAPTTTAAPKKGGTITFGVFGETPGLDPVVANGSGTTGGHEMNAIYDTIVAYNTDTKKYDNRTAESLTPNADFSEWTLKLKPGLKFTDGTAYDAEAVVFNIRRHTQFRSRAASIVARIKDMAVVDPATVKFTLTSAWSGFPYVLAYTPGMVGSPTALKACGEKVPRECDYNLKPVGAGPFVIDSFKPKDSITMKKNPAYHGGEPYLDGLKFVFLDTGSTKTYDALKNNTLQAAFLRNSDVIKAARETDKIPGYLALNWMGGIVLMNNGLKFTCNNGAPAPACTGKANGEVVTTAPPTSDKRIRQAVALASDPKTLDTRVFNGTGFPGTEIFQKDSRFFNNTPGTPVDAARAKALVEEVKKEGKWDGSIRLNCHNGNPQWGPTMQALLEQAGFKVNRKDDYDVGALIQDIQIKKDYDLACWGFNVYEDDPFINLSQNLLSTSAGNWMGYANPQVDTLLNQAVTAKDDAARKGIYDQIAKIWNEDVPSVVFQATPEYVSWRKEINGIRINVTNSAMFDKAWIA
jgi:peptide/nickel transport system substrate-binding protein